MRDLCWSCHNPLLWSAKLPDAAVGLSKAPGHPGSYVCCSSERGVLGVLESFYKVCEHSLVNTLVRESRNNSINVNKCLFSPCPLSRMFWFPDSSDNMICLVSKLPFLATLQTRAVVCDVSSVSPALRV